jgi:TP901-1 family phage major tail protein
MAAQKGRNFLLKQGTAAGGTTLAGMRTTGLTVNNEQVDITNKDSGGWRTLLEAAGTQSMDITVEGVFTNAAVEHTVRGYAVANSINAFALVFGDGDYIEGNFAISNYQRSGAFNGEETYSLTLQSSGQPVYTSA